MQRFALNDPKAMKLYELVGGRVPFLLHTGDYRFSFSNPEQLKPVLEAFPETTFVGAHMGGYTIWKEAARALAGRYDNLYVDISSTFFGVTREEAVSMVRAYGAERVLFGTDFPMWRPQRRGRKIPRPAPDRPGAANDRLGQRRRPASPEATAPGCRRRIGRKKPAFSLSYLLF